MDNKLAVTRVIIKDTNGKILFLKRKDSKNANNMWCLPGGRIDSNEKAEEAIIRESKEEINLDLKNIIFLFDYYIPAIEGQTKKQSICSVFQADYSGNIKLNSEHSEFVWISSEDMINYSIAFNHNKIIEKFLSCSRK